MVASSASASETPSRRAAWVSIRIKLCAAMAPGARHRSRSPPRPACKRRRLRRATQCMSYAGCPRSGRPSVFACEGVLLPSVSDSQRLAIRRILGNPDDHPGLPLLAIFRSAAFRILGFRTSSSSPKQEESPKTSEALAARARKRLRVLFDSTAEYDERRRGLFGASGRGRPFPDFFFFRIDGRSARTDDFHFDSQAAGGEPPRRRIGGNTNEQVRS